MMMMMMKKSSLWGSVLLLVLLAPAASGLGSVLRKYYSYKKDDHLSWAGAQTNCRREYNGDLAVFYTASDLDDLDLSQFFAWIGLHRLRRNQWNYWSNWKWSNLAGTSFSAWASSEPSTEDDCGVMSSNSDSTVSGFVCSKHFFIICHEPHNDHYHYFFMLQSMTWSEAQDHCRSRHSDLATFRYTNDLKDVDFPDEVPVWTGLHRQGGPWEWSKGLSDFRNWRSGQPSPTGQCVTMASKSKKMSTASCATRYPFLCHTHNLLLVKEEKTWEEALDHCRALDAHGRSHDLLSLRPGDEHAFTMNIVREANTNEVWTGLRFLAGVWWWVNGAELLYPGLPPCPPDQRHCGILNKNDQGNVEIRNCSERRNFLCYIK